LIKYEIIEEKCDFFSFSRTRCFNCGCYDKQYNVIYQITNGSQLISTIRLKGSFGETEKKVNFPSRKIDSSFDFI
jgi:hypothetical protein